MALPVEEVEELASLGDVTVADREVKLAEMLVESLTAAFDPDKHTDEYRVQVLDLIGRKAGERRCDNNDCALMVKID